MTWEMELRCVIAGIRSAVTANCKIWTRIEEVRTAIYYKLGFHSLGHFPLSSMRLHCAKRNDGSWMKDGDQLGMRSEYKEMCASRDIGNYAIIRELKEADTHVIVYLPEAIDPMELVFAQTRAAFAAQEKAEKRAVRRAARRIMRKKKRKPLRQTREKHLLQLWCAILDVGEVFSVKIDHHATTEELGSESTSSSNTTDSTSFNITIWICMLHRLENG